MDLPSLIKLGAYLVEDSLVLWRSRQGRYRELQSKRLKTLVKHAYNNVDLYRQKYDQAGVQPKDIQTVDDLEKLPIITKQDLIDGFPQAILARNIKAEECRLVATSGSTGIPIKIYKDRSVVQRRCLAFLFMHIVLGKYVGTKVRPGIVAIVVTSPGSLEAIVADEMNKLPRFLNRSYHLFDAQDGPHEHLRSLTWYQPDTVFIYPSVLRNMAIAAREMGLEVHQPRVLIISGEVMDENSRQVISSVFNGEIINLYAATEAGIVAMECGHHQGLHANSGDTILEIFKDGKPAPPGVPGNVIVTNLGNKSTPIIRYSGLGDVAVLSDKKCSCGSKLPLLRVVEGRLVDSLVLPDGRLVHPFSLTLALEHIPGIAQFQILQESVDRVRALIVAEKNTEATVFEKDRQLQHKILQNLKEILGEHICITVDLVDNIPRSGESGYQGTVRSLVKKPV